MQDYSSKLTIHQATEVTEQLYQACQRLVPQLTSNNPPPTPQELSLLISSCSTFLFVARHSDFRDEIIGMASLALYRVPTGLRAIIEDVVVAEKARGRRIGEALTQACLDHARQEGAAQVMLTSNPARVAANHMYQSMGFELRKTNVYKYRLQR